MKNFDAPHRLFEPVMLQLQVWDAWSNGMTTDVNAALYAADQLGLLAPVLGEAHSTKPTKPPKPSKLPVPPRRKR